MAGQPGFTPASNSSSSADSSAESTYGVGIDSRPLFTSGRANGSVLASDNTASRKHSEARVLGLMKSVARVE